MPGAGVGVDVVAATAAVAVGAVAFAGQVATDAEAVRYSSDLESSIGDVAWTLQKKKKELTIFKKSSFKRNVKI